MSETTVLAHLSDLHFGRHLDRVAESLLAELQAQSPALVVVSGDFTQRARIREFEAAREFLARLPAESLVVPGNHDLEAWNLAARMVSPLARYRSYIADDLQPVWENAHAGLLGVDSTRRAGLYLDWSRGGLSRRRLESICRHFEGVDPAKVKILVTHHPFARSPDQGHERPLIDLPREALADFARCGIDLILSGHFHHGHVTELPVARSRPLLAVQAGTGISDRLKGEANSYNRITLTTRGTPRIRIEARHLADDGSWTVTERWPRTPGATD